MDQDQAQQLELRNIFSESTRVLKDYNLFEGSKWSAEALNGLGPLDKETKMLLFQQMQRSTNGNNSTSNNTPTSYLPKQSSQIEFLNFNDNDKISLASSYFNCKEFERCSHVLKDCQSPKAIFIRFYSMYLSGEKIKEDESGDILGPQDGKIQNSKISSIVKDLESYYRLNNNKLDDPFLLYLFGLIYLKLNNTSLAQDFFYQSLTLYPFNWSCWSELISSLSNFNEAVNILNRISKNSKFLNNEYYNVMFLFFKITIHQEFYQQFQEVYEDLRKLLTVFPNFSYLKIQKALISYNSLDYSTAEKLFDNILINDPLRLDDMDTYSNILYVMEKKAKLGFLAQFASSIDKFKPETCCIIANYYSLKFDHQKAIMYYKRALALNKNCLSAWTLMGHEFVELKNSHAAIESYRRAVDTNNKDFRAWYGLGQAYEVLDMHLYSLYYYQRACALKPLDKRMWQAVGNCFENLGEFEDSIKSYQRALKVSSDPDPVILYKLANLYQSTNDVSNTAKYMRLCLNEESTEGVIDETARARLWLAKFELANKNFQMAYNYASEMTHGSSHEIEEARTIVREARLKLNNANPSLPNNTNSNVSSSSNQSANANNPNPNSNVPLNPRSGSQFWYRSNSRNGSYNAR